MRRFELIAPCHFGMESVLKREITDLGYDITDVADGRVTFFGDEEALCRATKSGIVLPGQNKEKPQQAEVVAVGPGGVVDGKEVKMEVKVGDQVIYSKYSGTEVKLDDEEYIIVKQSDILAIIQ